MGKRPCGACLLGASGVREHGRNSRLKHETALACFDAGLLGGLQLGLCRVESAVRACMSMQA